VAQVDCNRETAIDVANGPPAANEMLCGRDSQALIAGTQIRPREGEYLKIVCQRSRNDNGRTG
jgi:hypothetical protein